MQIVADSSGMLTVGLSPRQSRVNVRPAFLNKILGFFKQSPTLSSELSSNSAGHAGSASPSVYEASLFNLRYERRAVIADARLAIRDDLRARKSTLVFAREATRGGCVINLDPDLMKGITKKQQAQATESAKKIQSLVNKSILSWGWMLMIEGDLFIQIVPGTDGVVALKRMPAASMERLSDDTDEFPNPKEAFAQVDISSEEELARFPLGLMVHERWNHIDGERYGETELVAIRRQRRVLELIEASQAVRRMSRAAKRTLWNIGTATDAGQPSDIEQFRAENGFVKGKQEIFDPANVAMNYFGNGKVSASSVDGDTGVDSIRDIEYLQDTYAAGLPTPGALWNLASGNVNRDVLEDQRAEWLKSTEVLTEALTRVIARIFEMELLLNGILPETVNPSIVFSESSIERPSEVVDRVLSLLGFKLGQQAYPLITLRRAYVLLADILKIEDIDGELKALEKDNKSLLAEVSKLASEAAKAMQPDPQEQAMPPGAPDLQPVGVPGALPRAQQRMATRSPQRVPSMPRMTRADLRKATATLDALFNEELEMEIA